VGTLGTTTDAMGEDMRNYIDQRMLLHDSLPVWIPDAEFEDCYDEFCHQNKVSTLLDAGGNFQDLLSLPDFDKALAKEVKERRS
jgi:hypothetical protein